MTFVLGLDPGLTGAIAFYVPDTPERVGIDDMPVVAGEVDPATLARLITRLGPSVAVIERVNGMPTDGGSRAFKFGDAFGVARGVIAALQIPVHFVTPGVWKKFYKLKAGPDGKEHARSLALQLFPKTAQHFALKKHHGRAEAALIARWYAETMNMKAAA
jgi:hypothetical protein